MLFFLRCLAVAISLFFFTSITALAAPPGTLDDGFDTDGKLTTDISDNDEAFDAAVQPDGKIVVVGVSDYSGETPGFIVCRYNTNGSPDATFNGGGIAEDPGFTGDDTSAWAVALQTDGKIVVAGRSGAYGNSYITVVRYTTTGTLDTTFSNDGIIKLQIFPNTHNWGDDVLIQPDGKIVVAGTVWGTNYDYAVIRFTGSGETDTSFDTDGIQTIDFGNWDFCNAVALQTDGKIIAAGRSGSTAANYDFSLVRLNESGETDTTFGTDGKVTTDISSGFFDEIMGVALRPDGKILAGGLSDGGYMTVARYTTAGSLDSSFGISGLAVLDGADGYGIALSKRGDIVATGFSGADLAVVRFRSSGSLDKTFGTSGSAIVNFVGDSAEGRDVAIQPDGKIIAVGKVYNGVDTDIAIVRLEGGPANLVPERMLLIGD